MSIFRQGLVQAFAVQACLFGYLQVFVYFFLCLQVIKRIKNKQESKALVLALRLSNNLGEGRDRDARKN